MITEEIVEAMQLLVDACEDPAHKAGMESMKEMLQEWSEWDWMKMFQEDKEDFVSQYLPDTESDTTAPYFTMEQQTQMLHDAARDSHMDGHVQQTGNTAAEQVMQIFGGRKDTPRKMSYLYCDSVDCCFYFQGNKACCTFTAKWYVKSKDLSKLDEAGELIKIMLTNMQRIADATVRKEEAN